MNAVQSRPVSGVSSTIRGLVNASVVGCSLAAASISHAQLVQFVVPGDTYRAGKITAFSPAGQAITGYLVSDGLGGNPTPTAFTLTKSGTMLMDSDHYTIGLSVSNDGTSAVRATASLGGVGFLPNGSKIGSMSDPAGTTLLPFRSLAASSDGQFLVGRDPSVPENNGFSRFAPDGPLVALPTLPNLPEPRNLSVSRDGLSFAADFGSGPQSNPTPAVWTAEFGLYVLPSPAAPDALFSTVRQISGDGSTVVGVTVTGNASQPSSVVTKGGFWTVSAGVSAEFVELPGFSSLSLVNNNASVMFGFGQSFDLSGNIQKLVWTEALGNMTFAEYLALGNVQLPSDWTSYTVDSISGDGLSFAGFAVTNDGLTDVAFIVSIPGPASALVFGLGGALAFRRRR